jgi:proteasome lid subunit RPN8/RPN11
MTTGTAGVSAYAKASADKEILLTRCSFSESGPPAFVSFFNDDAGKMPAVPVATLILSNALHDQLAVEALRAYPRECCGLIEGIARADTIEAVALHPTRNLAHEFDRFEIDPTEQFRLLRNLRGTGRTIVGCYHSHPDGAAIPSARDSDAAGEENFVWLIAGAAPGAPIALAAFVFAGGAFRPLQLIPLLDCRPGGPV